MLKIGNVILGKQPKIVLTIGEIKSNLLNFSLLKKADILELRIDCFKNIEKENIVHFVSAVKKKGLPIIATVRSKKEGGQRNISANSRLKIFKIIAPIVEAVDIEMNSSILDEVVKEAKANKKRVILSYHNFKQTPANSKLEEIVRKGRKAGGEIIKIATFAENKNDVLRLLNIAFKHREKNIVAISLGEKGVISRLLFPFFGSLWTYTYLDKPFAPGQMNINRLQAASCKLTDHRLQDIGF
ncbi:MAG: type I 3-dehydroquinate dehydratase [Candidatus Omnitrophica bacterium]|nr:type I 3-dehydroquinate dehydratase [Candidatus Omnitrophota bacterium]